MKFAVVSYINTPQIKQIFDMFDYDIDNSKPDYVITYGGDGTVLLSERTYPGIPKITLRASKVHSAVPTASEGGEKCAY